MRIRGLTSIVVGLTLAAALAARADEVTRVSDALGPEGPLFVDGNLYYVAWTSSTLSKWDGKTTVVLNSLPGCSHSGLALTAHALRQRDCWELHPEVHSEQGRFAKTSSGQGQYRENSQRRVAEHLTPTDGHGSARL